MELWYTEKWTENTGFSIKVKQHLCHRRSDFQEIDVFDSAEFGRFLTLDGLMMVTEKDEFIYHDMIVHVPMAVNPSAKRALVIGGGDGGTARELLRYSTIEHVDMVEIDKGVTDACREFLPITASCLDDKRLNLVFDDGVKFVKNAKDGAYDLVIVDSTDPIGPGEGLFTSEFYRDCYRILNDNGILTNQNESPYFDFNRHEMQRAHSKIKKIFPVSQVYQAHITTYPSGHWLFGFASKGLHPINDLKEEAWKSHGLKTKYYNTNLHRGCFALPTYVQELLGNV